MITEREALWAAGFFDGEGCTMLYKCPDRKGGHYLYARLAVNQVELEPLARFHAAVGGAGTLNGPYKDGRQNASPIYLWAARSRQDVVVAMNVIYPHLCGPKQRQYDAAEEAARADRIARSSSTKVS